jgi:hypothetical protein
MTSTTESPITSILDLTDEWAQSVAAASKTVQAQGDDIAPLRDANVTQTNEARLAAQMKDLDRLFVGLTQRAARCGDANQISMLLGLALRCQRHGVQTALALHEMQSKPRPPVIDVEDVD